MMDLDFAQAAARGWKASGLGLLAVFGVLFMIYLLIRLMTSVFPERPERDDEA